jgi:hypothetical protein
LRRAFSPPLIGGRPESVHDFSSISDVVGRATLWSNQKRGAELCGRGGEGAEHEACNPAIVE